jgi:hypothetical protein
MSVTRKIRKNLAGPEPLQLLQKTLTDLQGLQLAEIPGKLDELRQLIEALVEDYEGLARRELLMFHLFEALVAQAPGAVPDQRLGELRRELLALDGAAPCRG